MTTQIHPTAIIHPAATIADDVQIGAYCVVGEHVSLARGVVLHSHVVVEGHTSIGEETRIFPFASIGHAPQDLKYKGEPSTLVIGKRNTIREHVTMNPGTADDKMTTVVGDNNLFMMASHVAHDCIVGNHVILANNATLAGHVEVGDHAIIGGLSAVHQFVRIGAYAIIGGMSGVANDVIPYGSVMGERAFLAGLNLVGLKRRGVARENIHALRGAYKSLFDTTDGTLAERIQGLSDEQMAMPEVQNVIAFLTTDSSRSFCLPKA
jgi:UDP-N-acetylglucosamine acyltransferase